MRKTPIGAVLLTFAVGFGISFLLATLDSGRRASEERSAALSELAAVRAQLEGVVKSTFSSTDGLVHLVAINRGMDEALFAQMARLAIGKNAHIRNVALAPGEVVKYLWPLAGNEKAVGFAYRSSPEQYRTVSQARLSRASVLAGPVDLVQGGRGFIHRTPVFLGEGADRYWGVVSIVTHVDTLLAAGGVASTERLLIALRGKDGRGSEGEMIAGESRVFAAAPVTAVVPIPGGEWQLGAIPRAGWADKSPWRSVYFLFGMLNTLMLTVIVGTLALQRERMRRSNEALVREMAERERVRLALREEQDRFRTLFESSPDPVWIIENNSFVECNETAARMLGYASKGDFLYVHPSRLSPEVQPDGESSFAKAERMMSMARERGINRFEWIHTRADGENFPAEVTLCPIVLQGREVIYCIWRDISERKRAEEALRASQELLRAVIDSAGVVIYAFDTEGRLVLCNRQFEIAVGHRREQILGKRRDEFLPAATAAQHEGNDRVVITDGTRREFEEENVEPDGVHTYFTVKCPVIEGGKLRAVVGVSADITEKKRDNEKLRLAATILATTAEGVAVTDAAGNILSVNRAFTEITGYTEEEVLGRNPRLLRSERHEPDFYQALWKSLIDVGVWRGEIWNRRRNGEAFPEWQTITAIRDAAGRTTHYVSVFSDISSLKRSQEELEHLAHFDPLTDLPNRMLFQDRLNHAIDRARRYGHAIAVLLLDLDGFKTVNDSLGHPVGDRLLQEVAGRLRSCIRVEDTVARMGGDEFALILSNLSEGSDAVEVVRKLLSAIQIPVELFGHAARVTASIGIAVYPADGEGVTDLVRNADAAMYSAKEAGRNGYRFYQSSMTQRAQERLSQERALRRGIEKGEFEVWFQPQLGLRDGHVTGAEALVRWRDPERGLIAPAQFIPLAERTGLIVDIGAQVLQQVCDHARRWLDAGLDFGRLAINVAAPQIERHDFAGQLSAALARAGVPPRCIEIEITESLIMENAAHARETLLAVQALGVTTAIDDFGTGYSSLAYLKQLPIDNLKIDRAFVKDLPADANDVAITRAIVSMAHSLGFRVIAEGIETEDQETFLRGEGCDEGQGYLFSKPLPAADFEAWLAARRGLR
jgi:diguanylate cyclase (GGDEF)-like protein/PAS domain S-box-containing protein